MATAKLYNMARMTTATTGTGTITLGSAVSGFISFATAGVTDGDVVTYAIEDGSNREIGRGTYTASGTTLARTTVLKSTNAGAAISLSGSAQVFITNAAEDHIAGPSASVDSEIALFSGTGGATLKRATQTGILKATSGVIGTAAASTDYAPATSGSAILKGNGTGGFSAAAAGTDYAEIGANTSITSVALNQTGLTVKGASANKLTIKPNETLSTGRTLNVVTGDADRTLTFGGNATVSQDYSTTASPTFANPVVTTLELGGTTDTTLARSAAGTATIEGGQILLNNQTATVSKGWTLTPNSIGTVSSGTTTPSAANGNYQYYTNNGAHTLAAPASDSAIDILVTNGASAGSITFSGFTVGASTGSTYATTNTNKYVLSIRRINSVSTYSWYALQ